MVTIIEIYSVKLRLADLRAELRRLLLARALDLVLGPQCALRLVLARLQDLPGPGGYAVSERPSAEKAVRCAFYTADFTLYMVTIIEIYSVKPAAARPAGRSLEFFIRGSAHMKRRGARGNGRAARGGRVPMARMPCTLRWRSA